MSEQEQEMSDEEALMKLASAMGSNKASEEDKQSVPSFLFKVVTAEDNTKIGNLIIESGYDELGMPQHSVRGCMEMKRISDKIMNNQYFADYFEQKSQETLASSLSREGFLIRQATTQTKQVADVTRKRKINKGWFGKKSVEETGGDTFRKAE